MSGHSLRPHYVYRHYSCAGELLYVGLTSRPQVRPYEVDRRPWLREGGVRVLLDGPMTEFEAYRLEFVLIHQLRPLMNTHQQNGYLTWVVRAQQEVADQFSQEERDLHYHCALTRAAADGFGHLDAQSRQLDFEVHASCLEMDEMLAAARDTGVALERARAAS